MSEITARPEKVPGHQFRTETGYFPYHVAAGMVFDASMYYDTDPSVLLVIGKFGATIHVLHHLPENGTIERFSLTTPSSTTTFRHRGAREQAREQIGTVTLHVGDGETVNSFPDDVETRIRTKLRNGSLSSSPAQLQTGSVEVTQIVQDVIQPAALDAIYEREELLRDRSMRATQTYPVFVVYIVRSSSGRA